MLNARNFVIGTGIALAGVLHATAGAQITAPGAISGLVVQYQGFYTQTSTSAPTSTTTHQASAFITFSGSNGDNVDFIDLLKPGVGTSIPLSGSGTFWSTTTYTYSTRSSLMSAWPNGTYTYFITDFDENESSFTLSQPAVGGAWPNVIPAFTPASYNGLQNMNPTQPRLVEVNSFSITSPANGQLSGLSINQRFGTLPGPTAWSSLTTIGAPTNTRTIPANALQPNTDYFATWYFDQRISTSSPPPSVVSFRNVSFGNLTRVAFRTGPATTVCPADLDDGTGSGTPDGGVDINDLLFFLGAFEQGDAAADLDDDGDPATGTPDGGVDINDLLFFLARFEAGC